MGNEYIKLYLLEDNIIVDIENLEVCTRKLLEAINEFNKISGYEASVQKPILFLSASSIQLNKRKNIKYHLRLHPKKSHMKYLGINLIKCVKICTLKTTKPSKKKNQRLPKQTTWIRILDIVMSLFPKTDLYSQQYSN